MIVAITVATSAALIGLAAARRDSLNPCAASVGAGSQHSAALAATTT